MTLIHNLVVTLADTLFFLVSRFSFYHMHKHGATHFSKNFPFQTIKKEHLDDIVTYSFVKYRFVYVCIGGFHKVPVQHTWWSVIEKNLIRI